MNVQKDVDGLEKLVQFALASGAFKAKIIDSSDIVVDERVRLKCEIPICYGYNRFLTCPPFVMSVGKFKEIVEKYEKGLIVQIQATGVNTLDKKDKKLSKELIEELEAESHTFWMKKLHNLVTDIEREAFKLGYYLATGFVGGHCQLCNKCIVETGNMVCRFPFKARPSMEALGIDIIKTCENVGLNVEFSSEKEVKWTGLLLIY